MNWAAGEALPWVLSLSCLVTWLQITTLMTKRRGDSKRKVVLIPLKQKQSNIPHGETRGHGSQAAKVKTSAVALVALKLD